MIERDGRVFIGGLGRDDPIWKRGSDARPIVADMQPEPVRGGHEDVAKPRSAWVPSANAEALLTFSSLLQKSRLIMP
jgi:hypothetical protein